MKNYLDLDKMDKADARVIIALDALKQLDMKKVVATNGTYLFTQNYIPNEDKEFAEFIESEKTCQACALGTLFVSMAEKFDNVSCIAVYDRYKIFSSGDFQIFSLTLGFIEEYLYKFFDRKQMAMIEAAFEGTWYVKGVQKDADLHRASLFNTRCGTHNAEFTLRRILWNIIDNNGTFIP